MAQSNRDAVETFMSITGLPEPIALEKLEEYGGDINEAVNAHFSEGDRNSSSRVQETPVAVPEDDFMDIDVPLPTNVHRPMSLLSAARSLNPFSILDSTFGRGLFDSHLNFSNQVPFVTHPREVRQIPIEVKDGSQSTSQSGHTPVIQDVTGTALEHDPNVRGTVIFDDDDDDDITIAQSAQNHGGQSSVLDSSLGRSAIPSAHEFENLADYGNDIEEEMVRAAIEASKREVEAKHHNQEFASQGFGESVTQPRQTDLEDPELARAVSLSLKTAEQEKVLREQGDAVASKVGPSDPPDVGLVSRSVSNGRLGAGSTSLQDEAEEVGEEPLVIRRSRRTSPGTIDSAIDTEASAPLNIGLGDSRNRPVQSAASFPTDEWGGMSSTEHDEALMLEAAMFGGIPEGSRYHFAHAPHQFMQPEGPYPRPAARSASPSLTAQRLIREQQDDEYIASLQADREKELRAKEEAEASREEERRREEELRQKLLEEQELDRQLAAKEVSLPEEPSSDDENAVTLLVRMPDGSRRGRRFLKSDSLQSLIDFIDIARVVKPGSFRLVRPYPRRAFSDGEKALTLNELGLTGKQEALFLEMI